MLGFFLTFAFAACVHPQLYGVIHDSGAWEFSYTNPAGKTPVNACEGEFDHRDLVFVKDHYEVDKKKKSAREALESAEVAKKAAAVERKKALKEKVNSGQDLTNEEVNEVVRMILKE